MNQRLSPETRLHIRKVDIKNSRLPKCHFGTPSVDKLIKIKIFNLNIWVQKENTKTQN